MIISRLLQIFRSLPCACTIISSLLQADCIGFHTYQYTRHFLIAAKRTAGAVSRTLPGGMLAVAANGREVILSMAVVSIETPVADRLLRLPETVSAADALRQKYSGKKIIASVDMCQRLSGGIYKLAGLECFLDDVWEETRRLDAVLVIRCIRTNSRIDDERRTSEELVAAAKTLNDKYGRIVVDYKEVSEFTAADRVALWRAADVYLSTSIREALNMHPMEYIYCRKDDAANPGVVIVSDMSASASLLSGSIKVNSFNTKQIADALVKALTMPAAEADRRRRRDLPYVLNHNASTWMREVIDDLQHGKQSLGLEKFNKLNRSAMSCQLHIRGLSASFVRALHPDINPHLKRVFVFDFEGTLVSEELFSVYFKSSAASLAEVEPSDSVVEQIRKLAENPCNAVLIVCGITRAKFSSALSEFRNVSIATSNGLECSWGLNVLSRDEVDKLSSGLAMDASAVADEGAELSDDDFRSVDSLEPRDQRSEFQKLNIAENVTGGTMPQHHIHSAPTFDANASESESRLLHRAALVEAHISSTSTGTSSLTNAYDIRESFDEIDEVPVAKTPRRMSKRNPRSRWEVIDPTFSLIDWEAVKAAALPVLSKFTATTNGTCLVPRVPGLGWNFFHSEPDWGEKQSKQLKVELESALSSHDVKVEMLSQGSLEIVPRSLRKGRVVERFLRRILERRGGRWPTFSLIVGNAVLDEDMFKVSLSIY
jgi:trehalose-6-phosphatase